MRPVEIRPLSLLFLAMLAAAQPAERPNGVLLVAKPGLTDPNFRETVVLVTQTPDAQTVGVILNRPTERKLSGENVFFGGPVLRESAAFAHRVERIRRCQGEHVRSMIVPP